MGNKPKLKQIIINNCHSEFISESNKDNEMLKHVLDYWQVGRLNAALPRTSFAIASLLPKSAVQHDSLLCCHFEKALATEESRNLEYPSAMDYDVAPYGKLYTMRNNSPRNDRLSLFTKRHFYFKLQTSSGIVQPLFFTLIMQ